MQYSASAMRAAPGPEQLPIIGNIADIQGRGLMRYYYDMWERYGDFVRLKLGPVNSFLLIHPDYIQHVMVKHPEIYTKGFTMEKLRLAIGNGIFTAEGDFWRKQRQLMQPTYTPRGIQAFVDIMVDSSVEMTKRWQSIPDTEKVDINLEMARLTMTIISRAMFSFDVGEDVAVGKSLHALLEWVTSRTMKFIDVPLYIPTPTNQRLKQAKQIVRDFIFRVIEDHRRNKTEGDLLALLMSAKDAETGEVMDDNLLHDEILITFFAGHETTASLLTWTWYLLSQHPEVEAKLHAEIDSVLGGRAPTMADIPNLKYSKMVLDEALRLYSPVAITAREAMADDVIDGYAIPKGSLVALFPYATHRHPQFWERPLAFYPEHFSEEQVEARPRYAYYPFGAGQRICIGIHFAQMEALISLVTLAQQFSPRLSVVNAGETKFVGVIRPEENVIMNLKRRASNR
ncbi:MAG: cytochrome P450 [Anaerolineae bacterium]